MSGYASYVFNSVTTPCWIDDCVVDLGEVRQKAVFNCDPETMGIYVENQSDKRELSKALGDLFRTHFHCEADAHRNIVKCARILLKAGADPDNTTRALDHTSRSTAYDHSDSYQVKDVSLIKLLLTSMGSDNNLQNPHQLQPGSLALQCVRVLLCASATYTGPFQLNVTRSEAIPKEVHARMSEIDTQCKQLAKRVEQLRGKLYGVVPEELVADFPLGKESDRKSAFNYDSGIDPKVISDYQKKCDRDRNLFSDIRYAAVRECNPDRMRLYVALETNPLKLNSAFKELLWSSNPNVVPCATMLLKAGANPNVTVRVINLSSMVNRDDTDNHVYKDVSLLERLLTDANYRDFQDPNLLKPNSPALRFARVLLRASAIYTGPFRLNVTRSEADQIPETVRKRMSEVHTQCQELVKRVEQVKQKYTVTATLLQQLIPGASALSLSYLLEDNQMNVVAEEEISDCTLGNESRS